MAEVVLRDVRKSFDTVEIIHGVSLTIPDGEFVVFVGPSGCGKSTLLRLIAGLETITAGELSIVAKENTLTIKGEKSANENGSKAEVLYRGIAARAFERAFQLADFVQVKNASLENGLLHVDLVREIPEAKKPRSIPISSAAQAPQVVDGSAEKVAA